MDTTEFHALVDQISAAGIVSAAEIETATRKVGASEIAGILNGAAPWRRALAERASELIAPGEREKADWLALLGAAAPTEVRAAIERIAPSEKGAKVQIARRRRALKGAAGELKEEVISGALHALDYDLVRETMARRDCYQRLVALAADDGLEPEQREAARDLAASDYDEIRGLVGIPTMAELAARGHEQRERRTLGDRMARMRREGVGDGELSRALALIGREPVAAALERREVPFGRACVEAGCEATDEMRSAWLIAGAAGPRRCERMYQREVSVRSRGSERSLTSLPEALERLRVEALERASN